VRVRVGELFVDRYEVVARAGEGGMGLVFRARDRSNGEDVALKLLKEPEGDHLERFRQEATLLTALDHPAIVRCLDHGLAPNGDAFLILEWLAGETLTSLLTRRRLSPTEVVELGMRLASGLAAAHAHGVIHRDIKPSNIVIEGDDVARVKLLDFGIARMDASQQSITRTGMIVGTAGYMAPEQASCESTIGPPADVFSLGCVLFECLTGQPAFRGHHPMALLAKLLFEEPASITSIRPDAPRSLSALIMRMLSKQVGVRPADGAAVFQALAELEDQQAASSPVLPAVISTAERRFVSVVAIGPSYTQLADETVKNTLSSHARDVRLLDRVGRAVVPLGARVQVLLDGTILVMLDDQGHPKEQAFRAARGALSAREIAKHLVVALVTGWSEPTGDSRSGEIGEILERAANLLSNAPDIDERATQGLILIDSDTRSLLSDRFEVVEADGRLVLRDEQPLGDVARKLLGRATPFVGRDRELRNICDIVESSLEEREPVVVVVSGEAGLGKSRLRQELINTLAEQHQDLQVIIGRGDLMASGSAFAIVGSSLRAALDIGEGESISRQREKIEAGLRPYVEAAEHQRIAEFLGEVLHAPFPDEASPHLRAARQNPQIMADQIARAYVDFIGAFTRARPTLLVLDDLHWADAPSIKLVDAVLSELQTKQLVVVAFARPEIDERFPRLWSNHRIHRISLTPLTRRAAATLVQSVLGDTIDSAQLDLLVERANGNAFFLEELIRSFAEGRRNSLPATMLGMLEMRLTGLSNAARQLLRAASVFGDGFSLAGIRALLGADAIDAVDATITLLVDEEVIVPRKQRRFAGQPEYGFRHALLREGVYATLTSADRRMAHARAGEWLLQVGENDASVLAHHFEIGGDKEKAAQYHALAAEQALSVSDFSMAIRAAERGLALDPSHELQSDYWSIIANASFYTREYEAAMRAAEQSLTRSKPGSRSDCRALGTVLAAGAYHRGTASQTAQWVARLHATEPEPGAVATLAFGFDCALMHFGYGEPNEGCQRHIARLNVIAAAAKDDLLVQAWAENTRASWARISGAVWASLGHSRAAAKLFEASGHRSMLPIAYMHLGLDLVLLGDYEPGDQTLERARSLAPKDSQPAVVIRHLSSASALRQGRFELAVDLAGQNFEVADAHDEHHLRVAAGLIQADAWNVLGDYQSADARLTAIAPSAAWFPYFQTWYQATLACLRLRQGRLDEADQAIVHAVALRRALGRCHFLKITAVDVTRAEILVARGQTELARRSAEKASLELLRRAERIQDLGHRRSFLDAVPDNARLLELTRRAKA
jgi:tetratricopeptide (TPR) repeat protein